MPVKKIIIVGSSSGLGKQLAIMYAQQNHVVVITGRRTELLEEVKNNFPANIITSVFDVTTGDSETQINSLIEKLGGLDLLIYNAGYGDPSLELVKETEQQTTLTNVNGFVAIIGFVFNYFVQQGHGHIALTSSLSGLRGNSWTPAYSASKAYMSNYAEGLSIKARKLKKDIAVTDIRPGFIGTKMAKGNKQFWVAPVHKAAKQIIKAIEKKRRVVYITKRWWLVAVILKWLPYSLYKRIA
jgi:short-subunit dehydrogenase